MERFRIDDKASYFNFDNSIFRYRKDLLQWQQMTSYGWRNVPIYWVTYYM